MLWRYFTIMCFTNLSICKRDTTSKKKRKEYFNSFYSFLVAKFIVSHLPLNKCIEPEHLWVSIENEQRNENQQKKNAT